MDRAWTIDLWDAIDAYAALDKASLEDRVKASAAVEAVVHKVERGGYGEAVPETGWVVEGAWSETCAPEYWAGSSLWSGDHMMAIRFARKEDAERASMMMLDGMNIRICEHAWG